MKKNILWNTVGSIFYCFCQWVITIVVVHMASYTDAGYLSLAMTTSSSFSAISLFSMRNYQVSDIQGEFNTSNYVGSRVLTCVFAFIMCSIVGFSNNSIKQALCINAFMLVRVAEAMVDVLHGINQKYDRYDYIGKSYIFRGVVTVSFFAGGFLLCDNLPAILYCMALANLVIAIFYDYINTNKLEKIVMKVFSGQTYRLLKKCAPIVVFTFLLSLENLIPKTILQQYYGTEALGVYSSIASPTLIVQVFASVVFNPFLPRFTLVYNSGDMKQFKKMLHNIYLLLLGLCIVVLVGATLLGKVGLTILFGKEILEYYSLFLPIVGCTALTAIVYVGSAIIIALRKINLLLCGMVLDFIICVLLTKPIVLQFEKNGVSIIQLITLSLYIVFMLVVCEVTVRKKEMEIK